MSYPVVQSHYQDIDGVLWGWRWSANQPNGHTLLTYAFPASIADYQGYTSITGFEPFNAEQQAAASRILAMYDGVCNVDIVFTTDSASANIRLAEAYAVDVGSGTRPIGTALGCAPDPNFAPLFAEGDTWFNSSDYNAPAPGNFAYTAGLMHEIGHALGLKHGHEAQAVKDANGVVLYTNPVLAPDHDSIEYSVMTYSAYPGARTDIVVAVDFPSTPMQDDILALQYLYGPNYNYNSGNTVYTWSPSTGEAFINGVGQGVTFHHKIFMTVWDGGGVDTYDFSNYTTNAVINLAPGGWSTPSLAQRADLDIEHQGRHFARGCIANAQVFQDDFHGYIENAIGGRGNDTISGNAVDNALSGRGGNDLLAGGAGSDRLAGGPGRDTLIGGTGADTFVFVATGESKVGALRDVILDLSHAQADKLDLHLIDADQRAGHAGNQAFTFIGDDTFVHYHQTHPGIAGMVRFDAAVHVLQGNVNANLAVDFEIKLAGLGHLAAGDLIL